MSQYEAPIIIDSGTPGKTVCIMGGVHGEEPCGVDAINYLKNSLTITKGKVILLYGNPRAIEMGVRYTEMNLNRAFRDDNLSENERNSYEYQRAQELKVYLDSADVLLDIHSSFVKESFPFIICEDNARDIVSCFSFPVRCSGFDELHPLGTDGYMNKIGKIGICIECGYNEDPTTLQEALSCVDTLLACLNVTESASSPIENIPQRSVRAYNIYKTMSNSFQLARTFADFETIEKGELIGTDGASPIYSDKRQAIVFARDVDVRGEEAFVLCELL